MKKTFLFFALTLAFLQTAFAQDLSKYNVDQKVVIYGYTLMLDGAADTMDAISNDELKQLNEMLIMADGDYELLLDDLMSNADLKEYKPESLYIRYEILRDFKNKTDIKLIDNMVQSLIKKGKKSKALDDTIYNILSLYVKGINPKSKYAALQDSMATISTLFNKLEDSADITKTLYYVLQEPAIKNYILTH